MNTKIPRLPTEEEKEELIAYTMQRMYTNPSPEEYEQEEGLIENAYIAVFDNYVSDSPGYIGKVMIVVYAGGVSLTEVYIWRQDPDDDNKIKIGQEMIETHQ